MNNSSCKIKELNNIDWKFSLFLGSEIEASLYWALLLGNALEVNFLLTRLIKTCHLLSMVTLKVGTLRESNRTYSRTVLRVFKMIWEVPSSLLEWGPRTDKLKQIIIPSLQTILYLSSLTQLNICIKEMHLLYSDQKSSIKRISTLLLMGGEIIKLGKGTMLLKRGPSIDSQKVLITRDQNFKGHQHLKLREVSALEEKLLLREPSKV